MDFEILGEIQWAQTIASGRSIRELRRLNRFFGVKDYETQISALR
jgi:hypothetical protein